VVGKSRVGPHVIRLFDAATYTHLRTLGLGTVHSATGPRLDRLPRAVALSEDGLHIAVVQPVEDGPTGSRGAMSAAAALGTCTQPLVQLRVRDGALEGALEHSPSIGAPCDVVWCPGGWLVAGGMGVQVSAP
jgi:hypothetical protein